MILMIWLLAGIMILLAASALSVRLPMYRLSRFERQHRLRGGDPVAQGEQRLEAYGPTVLSLLRLVAIILLGIVVVIITTMFGLWTGLAITLLAAIVIQPIGRVGLVAKPSQRFFDRYYDKLVDVLIRYPLFGSILKTRAAKQVDIKLHSRQELEHVLEQSSTLIEPSERDLLHAALHFEKRTVEQLMIPYEKLVIVNKKELLGPLVLDDLHKTKQGRFLVVDAHETVEGVLYLDGLLTVDATKGSVTAETAMHPGITRLQPDQSLRSALEQCIAEHHDTAVVVGDGRVVGMVTVEGIVATLLG